MKTNNIFRKVGSILAEINEQYQYLSESPENLNELELELLSANADFLAEHIKVLRKLNFTQEAVAPKTEIKTSDENISESPEYKESLHADADSGSVADDLIKQEFPESNTAFNKPIEHKLPEVFEPEEDTKSVIEAEEKPAEVVKAPASETTVPESAEDRPIFNSFFTPEPVSVNNSVQEQEEVVPESEAPIVNEVVIEEKVVQVETPVPSDEPKAVPTLNELISSQRSQASTLSQFSKPQQVTDLKSIISLNDKLLFIKDLFNGYSLAYSEAIEIINRFDSFDAADNFLKTNYSAKNNWAAKEATADKFYQLLNRRFSV